MRTLKLGFALLLVLSTTLSAQTTRLEFDAASVKESTSIAPGGSLRLMPDGGIQAQGIPVTTLITLGFNLQPYQLVEVPEWSRNFRYDVLAKPGKPATRDQAREMLQALLIERFRLAFHREDRQVDGFRLVRTRPDALGPNIKPSKLDCEKMMTTEPRCRDGGIGVDSLKATGASIWVLLQLAIAIERGPITDETGMPGTYDLELRWCNDLTSCDDRPSFSTALQEQLGLRLERRRVVENVLVVDRLERADSN